MAAELVTTVAASAVENTRADKLVFRDKPQTSDILPEKSDSTSTVGGSGDTPITPKDFYWDQILFYLISAILGLSFLDISVEFFRGSVIQCFTPSNLTRDQIAYVNNFCYSSLPNSQYYLIYILISAILIIAPHYLWNSYFRAHFDFFFDLVKKLNRLRDSSTGEYNPLNFELVKKLEQKFSKSNTWIFRSYKLKLLVQLLISIVVQLVNAFYFQIDDFNNTFTCPKDSASLNSNIWPINEELTCVYSSLTLLLFLRNTAFALVSAAICVIIFGLLSCFSRHTTELGAKDIATFCDVSCLPPEDYPYPSARKVFKQILCCGQEEHLHQYKKVTQPENSLEEVVEEQSAEEEGSLSCFDGLWKGLKQAFSPRITNDLDFLLLRLFYADSGHGQVFKDIQVHKELTYKTAQDHELLFLLNIVHGDLLDKYLDELEAEEDRKLQLQEQGQPYTPLPQTEEQKEWERLTDLQKYFYESGFGDTSPEEQVYSYFESQMGITLKDWSHSPLRTVLLSFLKFAPKNKLAIDISFGNKSGYSLVLARAFYEVVTIHFNKYYQNPKKVCKVDQYQANYRTFTFPADIFSQNASNINEAQKLVTELFQRETRNKRKVDLIMIGPITDRSKIVTANVMIEKLYTRKEYFNKDAVLIAVRPLMIGAKPRTDHFIQYKPPSGIFEDIGNEVIEKLRDGNVPLYSVSSKGDIKLVDLSLTQKDTPPTLSNGEYRRFSSTSSGIQRRRSQSMLTRLQSIIQPKGEPLPYGIAVQCNNIQCIFEFRVFRYVGRYSNEETPPPFNEVTNENPSPLPLDETEVPTERLISPLESSSLPLLSNVGNNLSDTRRSEPLLLHGDIDDLSSCHKDNRVSSDINLSRPLNNDD